MNTQELRKKSRNELDKMLSDERERLRDLTFRLSGAQLKNVRELHVAKKNIARILTVLNEEAKK